MSRRDAAQSLVELALVAPLLIVLAMLAWDGGSVLREQIILQQAARDAARVAATQYWPRTPAQQDGLDAAVRQAALESARDLPGLAGTANYLTLSYPDGGQSVTVALAYNHALLTPVLRNAWGGAGGAVRMTASATFFVPQLTPVPATIVPSTPLPTP
ncbi:MAG TPA: TadE family protein, partial [Chloroflexota bacterium]